MCNHVYKRLQHKHNDNDIWEILQHQGSSKHSSLVKLFMDYRVSWDWEVYILFYSINKLNYSVIRSLFKIIIEQWYIEVNKFVIAINTFVISCMSQFRGSEIIELQNFKPASVDDVASVHARAYVSGLEKVAYNFPTTFSFFCFFHFLFWSYLWANFLRWNQFCITNALSCLSLPFVLLKNKSFYVHT